MTLQLKPGDEFIEVQSACEKIETSEQTKQRISNRGENILSGLEVEISLKPDQWTRILGQTVLVILILGITLVIYNPIMKCLFPSIRNTESNRYKSGDKKTR